MFLNCVIVVCGVEIIVKKNQVEQSVQSKWPEKLQHFIDSYGVLRRQVRGYQSGL